ncbi:MAG: NADH-quinone oxidoreductase subunit NuoE [Myxococcaceae bacterium]|nr:NADH-quinone oxidoreductase subunit NuoE [Myxococcaceae bacterium]MCI0671127.1 NADH-quinone oxidoreductase subunit NuoE [Myxococcaceae bacterium]
MAEPLFTPEQQKTFDTELAEILTHYPPDRKSAAMLPAVRLLQSLKGWCPPEGLTLVAERLGVTKERAYEVASFYVMYHLKKPGKYVVDVCTNLSCSLRGAESLLGYLEDKLGVHAGESTEQWTLRETECLASCGTAPCLQINEDHFENLTSREKVDAVFAKLK